MDDLVVIGSPGIGVESVTDLDVGPYHVFAGAAVDDPISYLARFGPDPTSDDYGGGYVFEVDGGGMPGAAGREFLEAKGHSEYYGPNTESLQNIVNVIVGHPENVTFTAPDPYRGES